MLKKSLLFLCAMFFAISAFAAPVDLTSITNAVDFTTVIAAVLLVAAALAGVYIAWKGSKMILAVISGENIYALQMSRSEFKDMLIRRPDLIGTTKTREYIKKRIYSGEW